jgi:short-subunit dehydrogenase
MNKGLIIGANSTIAENLSIILLQNNWHLTLVSRDINLTKKKFILMPSNSLKFVQFDLEKKKYDNFITEIDQDIKFIFFAIGYLEIPEINKKKIYKINYYYPKLLLNALSKKKFLDLKNFFCITSVASDRLDFREKVYSFSKKKLSIFINKMQSQGHNITDLKIGIVRTNMTKKLKIPNLFFFSAKYIAKIIFNKIGSNNKVLYIPSSWKIILYAFNFCYKIKSLFKKMTIK